MQPSPPPHLIVDVHLDLSWNALSWNRDLTEELDVINAREAGMTDDKARGNATVSLPEMRRANVGVCVATILSRAKRHLQLTRRIDLDYGTQDIACAAAEGQLAYYNRLVARNEMRWITDVESLDAHLADWKRAGGRGPIGAILSAEGADPIVDPSQVEYWWNKGLRLAGIAHYGQGHYAMGTGGASPVNPGGVGGEGPITPRGLELLKEFERVGIALDLTHCAEPGFWQALDHFNGRVLASHQNCRALVPGNRQFSDEQLKAMIARNAVIGAVFDAWMLYPGWEIGKTDRGVVSLDASLDHICRICDLAGNARHVGIGSDLDGGFGREQCPTGLDTIADLQKLPEMLSKRGFTDDDIRAFMHGNWLRFFREVLPKRNATTGPA